MVHKLCQFQASQLSLLIHMIKTKVQTFHNSFYSRRYLEKVYSNTKKISENQFKRRLGARPQSAKIGGINGVEQVVYKALWCSSPVWCSIVLVDAVIGVLGATRED